MLFFPWQLRLNITLTELLGRIKMNILDLDLDFFLTSRTTNKPFNGDRADDLTPWSHDVVRAFLENTLGLNKTGKIKGAFLTEHVEVYDSWKKLIESKKLTTPFNLYHVDAHADLGMGDGSWSRILKDLLKLSPLDRTTPSRGGLFGLSSGNFIAYAIANHWINEISFIVCENWRDDIPIQLFDQKSWDYWISLDLPKRGNHELYIEFLRLNDESEKRYSYHDEPIHEIGERIGEPKVKFNIIDSNNSDTMLNDVQWDFLFLTQSPSYTPKSADALIPLIREYMDNEHQRA